MKLLEKVDNYPYYGLSIHLDIGSNGGWGIARDMPWVLKLAMGRVAITIALRDLDTMMGEYVTEAERRIHELDKVPGQSQADSH